mgnify:CR=1 FL=1
MKLNYYTLLCPEPIRLSIGTIKHPTLREISKVTYQRFGIYQIYLKLTPNDYYNELNKEKLPYWESLPDEQKERLTIWELIGLEPELVSGFLAVLNFFFIERIIFREGVFMVIDTDDYETPDEELEINKDNFRGMLHHDIFTDVLDILQQVCHMKSGDGAEKNYKFKNDKARKLYERMLKAKEEQMRIEARKNAKNYAIPNMISSVAAKSFNLNIINIWDATLFQLYDQFNKLISNDVHYINEVRVSVWGDEKNQFNPALWYKNQYENDEDDDLF